MLQIHKTTINGTHQLFHNNYDNDNQFYGNISETNFKFQLNYVFIYLS